MYDPFNIAGHLLIVEKVWIAMMSWYAPGAMILTIHIPEESNEVTVVLGLVNIYPAHGLDTSPVLLFLQPNDRAV